MSVIKEENIRNFCIIAHIDHGKSTLADRLIEKCGTIAKRDMEDQILDGMDLERERGITIKLTPVRMNYKYEGEDYVLNLIDTPGHVDFTYEVSRSLAACEGAILIVDATQGVEAQTLANVYLALDNNLEIMPVINKIDLPGADIEGVKKEIEELIGLPCDNIPLISAKEGIGIEDVIIDVIKHVQPPKHDNKKPLKALIFDSYYDNYKGVICFCRIFEGQVKVGDRIKTFQGDSNFTVTEVGYFAPSSIFPCDSLESGEVGYIAASIKSVQDTHVGDTITTVENGATAALAGYKKVLPMVYSGVYPVDGSRFGDLKDALMKLNLNDASLSYEPDVSQALGFGFRCGFLGLLHMEIIQERIEREFNLDIITTAPGVSYEVYKTNGDKIQVDNPSHLPPNGEIDHIDEPIVSAKIFTPPEFIGAIMELCQEKRSTYHNMTYLDAKRVELNYTIPLNEIIYDFFDSLKSRTKGYASLDYEVKGMQTSDLVKLDFMLNSEVCDALSVIVHREKAYARGRIIAEKLKDVIPRQMFEIPIQASVSGKVIARETVKAMRKDVLAKCYGGDISRKKKLLEKQKEGKKRMRQVGSVQIPSEAFTTILKIDS